MLACAPSHVRRQSKPGCWPLRAGRDREPASCTSRVRAIELSSALARNFCARAPEGRIRPCSPNQRIILITTRSCESIVPSCSDGPVPAGTVLALRRSYDGRVCRGTGPDGVPPAALAASPGRLLRPNKHLLPTHAANCPGRQGVRSSGLCTRAAANSPDRRATRRFVADRCACRKFMRPAPATNLSPIAQCAALAQPG